MRALASFPSVLVVAGAKRRQRNCPRPAARDGSSLPRPPLSPPPPPPPHPSPPPHYHSLPHIHTDFFTPSHLQLRRKPPGHRRPLPDPEPAGRTTSGAKRASPSRSRRPASDHHRPGNGSRSIHTGARSRARPIRARQRRVTEPNLVFAKFLQRNGARRGLHRRRPPRPRDDRRVDRVLSPDVPAHRHRHDEDRNDKRRREPHLLRRAFFF